MGDGSRRFWKPWVVAVVCIVVLVAAVFAASAALIWRDVDGLKADAETLATQASAWKDAAEAGDGAALESQAAALAETAAGMDEVVSRPWWFVGQAFPVYGRDVAQSRVLVGAIDEVAQDVLVPLSGEVAGVKLGDLVSGGSIDVALLQRLADAVSDVKEPLSEVVDTVESLEPFTLDAIESKMADVREGVGALDGVLDNWDAIMGQLPGMLGADGQTRTYLMLALNNVETRSIAGFPGSWGTISVTDGKMELGSFDTFGAKLTEDETDVELTDDESALFGIGLATNVGDTMQDPDFSRGAEIAARIWEIKGGEPVDGVVAVDVRFLASLMSLTGPVQTEWGVTLTGDNVAQTLMSDAYAQYDSTTQNEFFAAVAADAFASIVPKLGDADPAALVECVAAAADEGGFQMWARDDAEQEALVELGVAHELSTDETTPVLGVYTNDFTYSKMDWYLEVETEVGEGVANADGTVSYACTTTLTNRITAADLVAPEYVTGYNGAKRSVHDIITRVFLVAPAGGTVDDVTCEGNGTGQASDYTLYGFDVAAVMCQDQAGEQTVIRYTVTTSAAAEEPLAVKTTRAAREFE